MRSMVSLLASDAKATYRKFGEIAASTPWRGSPAGVTLAWTSPPKKTSTTSASEVPSVVLRIDRESIERLEAEEPELAATLHRWLATTLAERLTDTMRTFDVLLD